MGKSAALRRRASIEGEFRATLDDDRKRGWGDITLDASMLYLYRSLRGRVSALRSMPPDLAVSVLEGALSRLFGEYLWA